MLLLGAGDVAASKRFYLERGLTVARSFAHTYVDFAAPTTQIKLALYKRRALAEDAVSLRRDRIDRIIISSDADPFIDPDGFAWEAR